MSNPPYSSAAENSQIDQVSWELMGTYEALSSLSGCADLLAKTQDLNEAAKISLTYAIDTTESIGGLLYIPDSDGFKCLATQNAGEKLRETAVDCAGQFQRSPHYEDGPFESLPAEDGTRLSGTLYVPFTMEEGQYGFIFLFSTSGKYYSSIEVRIAQTLCDQGALSIRCLLHLQELKKKNKTLQEAFDALKEAQEKLVNSERLSALGQMAAMVVHDLKNPMTGLLGYAQLLETLSESLSPEEIKEYAGIIVKEIQRLSEMTEEIMDYARGLEIKLNRREVTVRDIVAVASPVIQGEFADHQIDFQWSELDEDVLVMADTDKIERVLINLAVNARHAMDHGGSYKITSQIDSDQVMLVFQDSGTGIPPEKQDKIFEPFQTTKKGTGLGLGLAVARWIVEAHGGKIWLERTGSQGSEFRIILPRNRDLLEE